MPLVCLHYSRIYREKLMKKEMKGGVLKGEWRIPIAAELFIFVSEADSVEEGKTDHKIGMAKILSCEIKKVKELSENEANVEGFKNRQELIDAVKYWHEVGDEDNITFIKFDLDIP